MNRFIRYAARQVALLCFAILMGYIIGHMLRGY
jgi:hypothetical protein